MCKKNRSRYNSVKITSQSICSTINARNYPRSHFYRRSLMPLVGKQAVITGTVGAAMKEKIQGHWYLRFALMNVTVLESTAGNPEQCGITEHIWIICEPDYLRRNKFKSDRKIVLSGWFYEYKKHDSYGNALRNIGFKLSQAWNEAEYTCLNSKNVRKDVLC